MSWLLEDHRLLESPLLSTMRHVYHTNRTSFPEVSRSGHGRLDSPTAWAETRGFARIRFAEREC